MEIAAFRLPLHTKVARAPLTSVSTFLLCFSFGPHRSFLNPIDGPEYKSSPCMNCVGETCIGSSGSWLRQFYLYNPFTLRKIILPYDENPDCRAPIFAPSRPDTPESTAILCCVRVRDIYCLRHGDKRWRMLAHVDANEHGEVVQAVAIGGKFYVLTSPGSLAHSDLDRDPMPGSEYGNAEEHAYLVESNGMLLVAVTGCNCFDQFEDAEEETITIGMLDSETSTWLERINLYGDREREAGRGKFH